MVSLLIRNETSKLGRKLSITLKPSIVPFYSSSDGSLRLFLEGEDIGFKIHRFGFVPKRDVRRNLSTGVSVVFTLVFILD